MKVRIIKKPEYTALHHVQVKRWWWPFWMTVARDDLFRCREIADNLITRGKPFTLVMEAETK